MHELLKLRALCCNRLVGGANTKRIDVSSNLNGAQGTAAFGLIGLPVGTGLFPQHKKEQIVRLEVPVASRWDQHDLVLLLFGNYNAVVSAVNADQHWLSDAQVLAVTPFV